MADYPTFIQLATNTDDINSDDRISIVSEGGVLTVHSFYHIDDIDFLIGHDLTAAQVATLMSHYRAHTEISFNFTYQEDSVVYVCRYGGIPVYKPTPSCNSLSIAVALIESSV